MGRLPGFDYKKPFFYMVTLKRARGRPPAGAGGTSPADAGLCKTGAGEMPPAGAGGCKTRVLQGAAAAAPILPFCAISDDGRVLPNAITEAFEAAIGEWAAFWRSVESVLPHVIMPDHLHLLVKLAAVEKAVSLAVLVGDLKKRLNRAYWAAARGMSPADAGLCKTRDALMAAAARIGPGGAGLSTFLSPLEKDAGNAIVKAGGALIVLSMYGFGERWHPGEKQERLCAAGRMLYLSPYGPQRAKLDKKEMHIRAHALVDWALEHSHRRLEAWP